jgi:DNA adenine methylase
MKPFLKWVGGKTQILETVFSQFPKEINNYHEPFLGGGSVLLKLLSLVKEGKIPLHGKCYASDINKNLIYLYKNIQCNVHQFIIELNILIGTFTSIKGTVVNRKPNDITEAITSKESYYYWIRALFNKLTDKTTISASAMLLFMNKTCFRGLYREGPNGFNVPYGNYKTFLFDEKHIIEVSVLIKDVIFTVQSFQKSMKQVNRTDFIYLDPPYAPENEKSFVGDTAGGFNEHGILFKELHTFHNQGIHFVMSNADVQLVRESFKDDYITTIISCRRAINSKNPESKTNEVLITNCF